MKKIFIAIESYDFPEEGFRLVTSAASVAAIEKEIDGLFPHARKSSDSDGKPFWVFGKVSSPSAFIDIKEVGFVK